VSGLSPTSLACSIHHWNLTDKIVWSGKLSAKQRTVSQETREDRHLQMQTDQKNAFPGEGNICNV
jgi:late competence protein required for DNA uptake (superfamily II DNA/RNA helicase)